MNPQTQNNFYKYNVNGQDYFDALPDYGNTPQGYTSVSAKDFIAGVTPLIEKYKSYTDSNSTQNVATWQKALLLAQSASPTSTAAGQSGVTIQNGAPKLVSQIQAESPEGQAQTAALAAQNLAQAKAGTAPTKASVVGGSPTAGLPNNTPPTSTTSVVKDVKNSDGTSSSETTQTQTPIEQQAQEAATTQPTGYQGNSIVDYLKSIGQPSDFTSRSQLASQNGITGYRGTSSQNIDLLNKVRSKPGGLGTPTTSQGQGTASQISPNAGNQTPAIVTPQVASVISQKGFSPEVITAQAQKSPFNAFVDAYSALYKDMGLPSVKSEYEALTKSYKEIEDKKNDEIADINEDPWLTEGVRQKRVQSIENRYETKTLTLTNQMKQMESLYEKGQQEVQFIAGQAMQASHQQAVLDQAWSIKAMELAQKEAESSVKEDFTLSPGSVRYSSDGRVIASVPKTAEQNGGLSSAQISGTINQISGSFDNDPAVKKFLQVQSAWQTASGISNTSANSADDISLIYAFAKSQDPESVVREGEYATVQKYAQSWAEKFGFDAARIFSNTKFLSEGAVKNLKSVIEAKYKNEKVSYDNAYSEYNRRIEQAKSGQFNSITNYSVPISGASSNPPPFITDADMQKLQGQNQSVYTPATVPPLTTQPAGFFDSFLKVFGF